MHKTIWFKIHWILGITAGIVLFVVGVTGATLSFEKCKRFAERNRRKHGYRSFRVYAETKEKNISFSGGDRNAFTGSDYVY